MDFVQRSDLGELEGADLSRAQCAVLAFCLAASAPGFESWPANLTNYTGADLAKMTDSIRAGLLHVAAADEEIWEVPGPIHQPGILVRRSKQGTEIYDATLESGDESLAARVTFIAHNLIRKNPNAIRLCKKAGCGRMFVKVKRKEFCSQRCADYQRKFDWRSDDYNREHERILRKENQERK